jgi:hypothetical protein
VIGLFLYVSSWIFGKIVRDFLGIKKNEFNLQLPSAYLFKASSESTETQYTSGCQGTDTSLRKKKYFPSGERRGKLVES